MMLTRHFILLISQLQRKGRKLPAMGDFISSWIQIVIQAPAAQADAAADFLAQLTGAGVETVELDAPAGAVRVIGYLAASADTAAQRAAIEAFAHDLAAQCDASALSLCFKDLAGQDWGENWKQNFKPRAVSQTFVVAPPWERSVRLGEDQKLIVIDPGQAFGTGQHESTALCLQRLEGLDNKGRLGSPVLDVGCGSGILALAAAKLGVPKVVAIDIDPEAVRCTAENALHNGLAAQIEVSDTPLDQVRGRFALVMANLTANDLIELAEPLRAKMELGGYLICSGMLTTQLDQVRQVFEGLGLSLIEQNALAGWGALVLV